MKKFTQAFCICASLTVAAFAADKLDKRIEAPYAVLHELMATPDKGIPEDIASKATCVEKVRDAQCGCGKILIICGATT
jgi:SH3 domain-containing YSC84-like protein 1